jgi:hypothetical protein
LSSKLQSVVKLSNLFQAQHAAASEADADAKGDGDGDSMRKDLTDANSSSKTAESVHQLETPEWSVHRAPVISSLDWTHSPVVDSLASSIVKGDTCRGMR